MSIRNDQKLIFLFSLTVYEVRSSKLTSLYFDTKASHWKIIQFSLWIEYTIVYDFTSSFRIDWVWADSVCIFLYISWNAGTMKTYQPPSSQAIHPRSCRTFPLKPRNSLVHCFYVKKLSIFSLSEDVLWGSFVTHSFLPQGHLLNSAEIYVLVCLNKPIS